jgi:TonB family protein
MIREKLATQGLLKTLSAPTFSDPSSGIRIPKDVPVSAKATANSYPVARDEDPPVVPGKAPGIARQLASVSKSPKVLASQVFRTDTGLEGSISGGIDDESRTVGAIAATVSQYRSGIKYAYNNELLKNPNLSGKITVAFIILPNGSVESAQVRQSSVNWPPLEDAVLKRLSHWKFPRSKGASVQVVFPFVFHPEM